MAKKATTKAPSVKPKRKPAAKAASAKSKGSSPKHSRQSSAGKQDWNVTDALIKLIESPLVADLLAVGATAALAAITESRSGRRSDPAYKSSKAVKAAGVAAAAAMGRRLAAEVADMHQAGKSASAKK